MTEKENNIIIYADSREANRISKILKDKCRIEEKQLDVADYVLSEDVGVERKTTDDFVNSIIDGRLFAQVKEMKNNFQKPLLIIEGEEIFENNRKINPNAVIGALASITLDYSVPVLWTKNQKETAALLLVIAKREQEEKKKSINIRFMKNKKSTNQQQEFLVAGLPKINTITAKKLLKHFETPERIFSAGEDELQEVDGIGKELARKIRDLLSSRYEKSVLEE